MDHLVSHSLLSLCTWVLFLLWFHDITKFDFDAIIANYYGNNQNSTKYQGKGTPSAFNLTSWIVHSRPIHQVVHFANSTCRPKLNWSVWVLEGSTNSQNKHSLKRTWKHNNAWSSCTHCTSTDHTVSIRTTKEKENCLPKLTSVATIFHSHFCIFWYRSYLVLTACSVTLFYIHSCMSLSPR